MQPIRLTGSVCSVLHVSLLRDILISGVCVLLLHYAVAVGVGLLKRVSSLLYDD